CLEHNVVLIAYSMFIPYMLLVFQTILKSAQHIDADRLDAYFQAAQKSIQAAQEELEGCFARSLTMLGNSRNDLSTRLSKVSSSLTALQIVAVAAQSLQPLVMLEGQAAHRLVDGDRTPKGLYRMHERLSSG